MPAVVDSQPVAVVIGLRQWRRLRNLSQSELAAAVGVTPTQVSAWETGRYVPHVKYVRRLLRVLQAPSLEALFPEPADEPRAGNRRRHVAR